MQMVVKGVSTRRVKEITTELCGREFSKSTIFRLTNRGHPERQQSAGGWSLRPAQEARQTSGDG
jgi:transposase-like protein